MLRASLKGMLSRRLRLLLTATSIALGVAFLAGTLMLTSSMQRAFDELFAEPVMRVIIRSPEHTSAEFSRLVDEVGLHGVAYSVG